MNFKKIHIGSIIKQRVSENSIEEARICNFMKCVESDIVQMYQSEHLSSDLLLRWSKLLEYDLFRIYSQHLILFAPPANLGNKNDSKEKSLLPTFRKNIYTKEMIDFILKQISAGEKTKQQVITEYRIPKTTLYKWINKYKA